MRRLILMIFGLVLSACDTGSLRVQPVEEWQQPSTDFQVDVLTFREISQRVGDVARAECKRRSNVSNCDFSIVVDLNPRAPANAFQTLDDDNQPVIIFTRAMIQSVENPDELAFVMGHESAHHILRHIPRQSENSRESAAIFGELARIAGANDADLEQAQKLGAQVGAQIYVKDFELEADRLGTIITHRAGYNPLLGARYFARIPDPGDRFLGTHPPNAQRVEIVLETSRQLGLTQ